MGSVIRISFDGYPLQKLAVQPVIKKCIQAVLTEERITPNCEVNVLVTNDSVIRSINQSARKIDKATDVLSFPMFTLNAGAPPANWEEYLDPQTGLCPLGDMVISLERAKVQAVEFGHTLRREIGYLTIHSMLHLLGYDHLDEGSQKAQMRKREEEIAATVRGVTR